MGAKARQSISTKLLRSHEIRLLQPESPLHSCQIFPETLLTHFYKTEDRVCNFLHARGSVRRLTLQFLAYTRRALISPSRRIWPVRAITWHHRASKSRLFSIVGMFPSDMLTPLPVHSAKRKSQLYSPQGIAKSFGGSDASYADPCPHSPVHVLLCAKSTSRP